MSQIVLDRLDRLDRLNQIGPIFRSGEAGLSWRDLYRLRDDGVK